MRFLSSISPLFFVRRVSGFSRFRVGKHQLNLSKMRTPAQAEYNKYTEKTATAPKLTESGSHKVPTSRLCAHGTDMDAALSILKDARIKPGPGMAGTGVYTFPAEEDCNVARVVS